MSAPTVIPGQTVRVWDAWHGRRGWRFGHVVDVSRTGRVKIRCGRRLIICRADEVRPWGGGAR